MKRNLAMGMMLVGLMTSANAKATMLEQMDTKSLTKNSKSIHIGEVTSSWSSPDSSNHMIYTYIKLKVDQTLKGSNAQEVLIRVPGGRANGRGMIVHGMAHFATGERTLVFLEQGKDETSSLVGMSQGKFRVFKSNLNGEDMALFQAPANVEFFTRSANGPIKQVVATQLERRVPLKTLITEIRSAMTEPVSN